MNTILVVLMLCGAVDTVLIKVDGLQPVYLHYESSPEIDSILKAILTQNPIVIQYQDDRGICA